MKNGYMKKRVSLLLCLSMVCAMLLAGCGGSKGDGLVGSWEGTMDLTDDLNTVLEQSINDDEMMGYIDIGKFTMTIQLTLEKDGKYTLAVDEKKLEDTMSSLVDNMKSGLKSYLEDMIKGQGIDMSVDEFCQAMAGMSYDDFVDQMIDMDSMVDQFTGLEEKGTYEEDGDKLVLENEEGGTEELTFKLDGDNLTLDSDVDYGIKMFPLEMKRQ